MPSSANDSVVLAIKGLAQAFHMKRPTLIEVKSLENASYCILILYPQISDDRRFRLRNVACQYSSRIHRLHFLVSVTHSKNTAVFTLSQVFPIPITNL